MDALGNVMLPMVYAGVSGQRAPRARAWRRWRPSTWPSAPTTARTSSLVASSSASRSRGRWSTGPSLILADEPTGALDSRTSVEIMAILQRLNREGSTIVLVTHEPEIAAFCGRIVVFRDGHVLSDRVAEHPESAEEALAALPADPLADDAERLDAASAVV